MESAWTQLVCVGAVEAVEGPDQGGGQEGVNGIDDRVGKGRGVG